MTEGGAQPRLRKHFVVCGGNSLAFHLIGELVRQASGVVTVVLPSSERNYGPRITSRWGVAVKVIEASVLDEDAFSAARMEHASAVALVGEDDTDNLRNALKIRDRYEDVKLVIRISDMNLGEGVKKEFRNWSVLSDAEVAAPSFAAAALGNRAFPPVELRDGDGYVKLYPAERRHVAGLPVVCELAVKSGEGESELLPGRAKVGRVGNDFVLARGSAGTDRREGDERLDQWWWLILGIFDYKVRRVIYLMLTFIMVSTVVLAISGHVASWVDALYNVILDSFGAAQADTKLNFFNQVLQVFVTFLGVAVFVPAITARVVTEAVRSRYPDLVRPRPMAGHVVVVGLGNLGIRVLEELRERGAQVLCVDKDKEARGVPLAGRYRVPVVFGDVSEARTLRAAYVDKCSALVLVTGNNVTNITAALHGRELNKVLRVVLRVLDDDLAEQVQRSDIANTHSVPDYAAPAFAAKMLDRDTLCTIPLGNRELLIQEVRIRDDAALVGKTPRDVNRPYEVQVIAVRWHDTPALTLSGASHGRLSPSESLSPGRRFASGDTLIIAATRPGLARVITESSPRASVSR